jgi:hypothetical protein
METTSQKGGSAMQCRVYRGPNGFGDIAPIAKEQMLFKEISALDGRLSWRPRMAQGGLVPLLIEGDDGARTDRRAVSAALRVGERVGH